VQFVVQLANTVKADPLLAVPNTVTITLPVVAPAGTDNRDARWTPTLAAVAVIPLNATVLVPWVAPKLVPVMVIDVPAGPEV